MEIVDLKNGYYLKPYTYTNGITKLRKYKKFCGVGIMDADYNVEFTDNGKRKHCPFYLKWCNMIKRCYYEKYRHISITYYDCYVCDDWLVFSNFKKWMEKQDWVGKQLDKDLITSKNKVYGPETCCFVSSEINNLVNRDKIGNSELPLGVWYKNKSKGMINERTNPFVAEIKPRNVKISKHFNNPEDAHRFRQKLKIETILKYIESETDEKIKNALIRIVDKLKFEYNNNLITEGL